MAALAPAASAQSIGMFTTSGALGIDDQSGNVGLNAGKNYLHAIDLGDPGSNVVNGVTFTGSGAGVAPSGTGWAITGLAFHYGGGGALPGGPLGALTNQFIYGGNPATFTLSGLIAGETYVLTFYNRSWEGAGNRVQQITASGASAATTVYDQNVGATVQGDLNLLRYTFQANSATQTLSISPQIAGNTMHFYAFTTERTFNNTWMGGTNWSTATWSVGLPDGAGANASFTAQAAPAAINLDAPRTLGHLQFDGANSWAITGASTLTLQADVGGVSVLSARAGTHAVAAPVALVNDVMKMGNGSVTLAGSVSGTGAIHVNHGQLTLAAANSYSGGTIVNAGATLVLNAAGALGAPTAPLVVNAGGTVDVSGNAQTIGNLTGAGGVIANDANGTSAVLTVGSGNAGGGNFAGVLSDDRSGTGTLGLTKVGNGTITLSGANTYSGPTSIVGGRLQLNGAAGTGTLSTNGIEIAPGAAFGFTAGAGTTLTLKPGSTFTMAGGTLALDIGSAAASDKIVADTLAFTANSALAITPISGISLGATYTLATYNTLSNPGAFTLSGAVAGRLVMNPVIGANAITLTPTLDSSNWNNAGGGTWSAGPWSSYTPNAQGDSAVFGPALLANGTVTVDSAKTVGYVTFNNSAASYTLGTAGSSNLTLNNGGAPALVMVNAGAHTLAENVALASDAIFTVESGATLTARGALSGGGALTKFGGGTLILLGDHTYNGAAGTTISNGTLQLGDGTVNGSISGAITTNATLAFNNPNPQTVSGVISGTGAVTKTGPGALVLTGANTFTGGLAVLAGMVDIGSGLTGSVAGPVVNNSTVRFHRTNAQTITSVVTGTGNTVVMGGTGVGAAATLAATAALNTPNVTIGSEGATQGWLTFGAPNQLNGTTGVVLNITSHPGNSRINLNGFSQTVAGLTGTGIVQNNESGAPGAATFTLNVPGANSYSWTGLIRTQSTGGQLNLAKLGTGEQTMIFAVSNGAGTYTGPTTISQGRLTFGSTYAAPIWGTSVIHIDPGAELGLTGAGAGAVSWGTNGRQISGFGGVRRLGADANTVTIANASNSYTGPTTLSGTGTLAIAALTDIGDDSSIGQGNDSSAATNAASLVLDGGALRYIGGAVSMDRLFTLTQNGGTLESSGGGAVNFNNSGAIARAGSGARTLTLAGSNAGNNTLAAALADGAGGATSLVKSGAGRWILSGATTYTGATAVNEGRLQLEGVAAASTASSNVRVNAGGTFGFGANAANTLAAAGTVTLAGGTVVFDLGSSAGSDRINAGTLALTANTALSFNQIASYEFGAAYTLASYTTLSNAGGFTVSGLQAGRLSLTPVLGANAITMTPTLDTAVWNSATGGTWSAGPWTGYTPNAVGDAALFGPALTANGAVIVDAPQTAAYLTFNNSTASYTIGAPGGNHLTLANAGVVPAQVVVNAGSHTIAENVMLTSDATIFTAAGTSLTVSGAFDGAARSINKNGPGTLMLSGTHNFGTAPGSGFNINQGTVVLGNSGALASATGVGINGGTLVLNGNDTTIGFLTGTSGAIVDASSNPGTTTLTIDQAGTSTFSGLLADGGGRALAVVKSGGGSFTLGGANTFTGGLTIAGGSLTAASGEGAAIPGNVTLGNGTGGSVWLITGAATPQYGPNTVITWNNGGTDAKFQLRGTTQMVAGLDADLSQSLAIIQNDEASAPGFTAAPGGATLILNTMTDHSFHGIIRNEAGGPLGFVKEGPGTQVLRNRADLVGFIYTGSTVVNQGRLVLDLSGASAAGFASEVTVNGQGTLGLGGDWTFTRSVNGTGHVVKQGPGTVTVSGTLSHTGNTVVEEGTLVLSGSVSASASIEVRSGAFLDLSLPGAPAIAANQTLKGDGTVFGTVVVNGTLAPGGSIGTLSMDALTLGNGSTFALEINTTNFTNDLALVNGAFSLSTGLAPTLSLTDLGANDVLPLGMDFVFLTYTGAWNGGLFRYGGIPIPDEGLLTFGANQFRLDYDAGGNSVALITVPEPSAGIALLSGAACLLGFRRNHRKFRG